MNGLFDLVRVATPTTGTGTITLGAAITGFLSFAQGGVTDQMVVSYGIADVGGSEVGRGTYTASGTTLSRDVVYRSTGAGNNTPISLSGSAQVFITGLAEDLISAQNYPPAAIDCDFQQQIYWASPYNPRNTFSPITRASVAYIDDLSGNWTQFAANTLRTSNKGALIEGASTNSIRNNTMQGAVVGTPGTLPNNWSANTLNGLAFAVTNLGTENGIPFIDINYSGTPTSTGQITLVTFENAATIAAAVGQAWSNSLFCTLSGGSFANTSNLILDCVEVGSGTQHGGVITPVAETGSNLGANRFSFSAFSLTNGATAFIQPRLLLSITSGLTVNLTLRIGWPQTEQGGYGVTSPIPTTATAATRAADVVYINTTLSPAILSTHTIYAQGRPNAPTTFVTDQYIAAVSDGGTSNRFGVLCQNGTGQPAIAVGTTITAIDPTVMQPGTSYRIAGANAPGSQGASLNGNFPQHGNNAATLTGVVFIAIGHGGGGGSQFWGYVERICLWPKIRIDDPGVQNLAAAPPNGNGQIDLNYGSNTNDNAPPGMIGEYISGAVASGSALGMTTGVVLNVLSLSLTAGDWDVSGNVAFTLGAGATATQQTGAIGQTSAALPTPPNGGGYAQRSGTTLAALGDILPVGTMRISLAATTTVYLVAQATFSGGTCSVYGFLGARRR